MSVIDTHCHLEEEVFDADRLDLLRRARSAGVSAIVSVGVDPPGWQAQRRVWDVINGLADTSDLPSIHLAFGLHPWKVTEPTGDWLAELRTQLSSAEAVVALGELGLDFAPGMPDEALQRRVFEAQLCLARELSLPLIMHARKSEDRLLWYLRRQPDLRGVVHGFTGSAQQAAAFVDQGFFIGVGGAITHDRASRLRSVIAAIPVDHLLLETDAPFQPGAAHRGQRNEPAFIRDNLDYLAKLHDCSAAEMAAQTSENARRLFGIAINDD